MQKWLREKSSLMAGLCFASLLIGAGVAYSLTKAHYDDILAKIHPIFVSKSPYQFINPLIGVSLPGDLFGDGFPDLRPSIESIVSGEPKGEVSRYAFYIRDLTTGRWSGINESSSFDPASLLKVVVAIAAYRQAEDQPAFLSTPLTYTRELAAVNDQLDFALPSKLAVGRSYLPETLIQKTLADSDNGAVYTLINAIPDHELQSVYQLLSIPPPSATSSLGYQLNAQEYSRFFRILYNGTLNLDWSHSEKILEDLSQSTFTEGLRAGVPAEVVVAHKYGEHIIGQNGTATAAELSDCGIVYYQPKPYFLCVMVQGPQEDKNAAVIAKISKVVYDSLSHQ